ncbi:MAG: hypothetical protein F6K58_19390 [Symploca sp. SIO2E9]|nr:hypothetical protein [Symploca sp. SIO2E9]
MSTSNQKLPEIPATETPKTLMPAEFLLSLATGPMLIGLLSSQAIFSWLQATGIASEEVFRGYSLPVLHFPELVKDD